MRGAVSLAAALALPLETDAGAPSRSRPDHLPRVRGHPRHARLPGPDAAEADSLAPTRGGPPRGEGRHQGPDPRRGGRLQRLEALLDEDWVRAETADRLRGLYTSAVPGSRHDSTARTTARSSANRPITSDCGASSSRRSGRQSSACAATGASAMKSCAGSSATSISKIRAWKSELPGTHTFETNVPEYSGPYEESDRMGDAMIAGSGRELAALGRGGEALPMPGGPR